MKENQEIDKNNNQIVIVVILLILIVVTINLSFFISTLNFNLTGLITKPMTLIIYSDQPPVIIISNFTAYVGDLIDLYPCATDPNGDSVTCTYSQPINSSGQWQTQEGDEGIYNITINATDGMFNVTKNITLTLIYSECSFNATRNIDGKTVNLVWDFKGKNYENFTLYWIDDAIEYGFINLSTAHNKSFFKINVFNDTNASSVGERYYQITGYDDLKKETCNITVGKYTLNFTPDHGRWNYQSIPFLLKDYRIETIFQPGADELEWAYVYNHSSGLFNGWNFDFDLGTIANESVYPGECVIVKPKTQWTNITVVGEIFPQINRSITNLFGTWNYVGWVTEKTPRDEALKSIDTKFEWLYEYNKTSGEFIGWFQPFSLGDIYYLNPGVGYIIKSPQNGQLYYNMYNNS